MHKCIAQTLAACFLMPLLASAECTVSDDLGHSIHLHQPAQHVISLAPDITETLFAIGAGHQMAGVMSGSDYPAKATYLPVVGSYTGIDIEKVIGLHPDLIVSWDNTFSRQLNLLKKQHIPIYTTKPRQLEDVARTLKNLGCLTGNDVAANKIANEYLKRLERLQQDYSHRQPVRVFYQIGAFSLLTINHDSWISQAIQVCGGRNVFADLKTITAEVNWEGVVMANPQVVITDATNPTWEQRWRKWSQVDAVKHNELFAIPPDLIDRAGPRLLEGVGLLCGYVDRARGK